MIKTEDVFGTFPILETERLLLRQITLDDAEDIFEYAVDPEMAKYVSWDPHTSIEDSIHFIHAMIKKYERICLSDWGIVYKENNKFMGTCGYGWWSSAHARAEIGYALSKKYWNRGLMTEALRKVVTFGFEKMKLNRIEARCFIANRASEKVMQKIGMKFEGIQREGLFAKEKYQDLKVYSILRREYYPETELT
jgi:ribosomal-protein-alanine N-acetyltransferase